MPEGLIRNNGGWIDSQLEAGPVISSRIRLARNLEGSAFPDWAGEEECVELWSRITQTARNLEVIPQASSWSMDGLDSLGKWILFERHLISRELIEKGRGSGVIISSDEKISLMINEEDHLRLQAIVPGFNLKQAYAEISRIDNALESELTFAFSSRLGYLTACPSNVGTGMRASIMLHLPGLVLMEEMQPILNGISKIGLAVRGLWGEGTEAAGNMFQISNQITLGKSEEDIIEHLEQIALELVEHENNARARLMESRPTLLQDYVGRAFGVLAHARILNSKEALDRLSALRLGAELGLLTKIRRQDVDRLFIQSQPAHLQQIHGSNLEADERDVVRAELIRGVLQAEGE